MSDETGSLFNELDLEGEREAARFLREKKRDGLLAQWDSPERPEGWNYGDEHHLATLVIDALRGTPPAPPDAASCEHCPDGHRDPATCPWAVWVGAERDSDGQPTYLRVAPAGGAHVAESDAKWLRGLMWVDVDVKERAREIATQAQPQPERWRCVIAGCNPKLDEDTAKDHNDATGHRVARWPQRSAEGQRRAAERSSSGYYRKYN